MHVGGGGGELIERRAKWELIAWVAVLPILGVAMVSGAGYIAWNDGRKLNAIEWLFPVGWLLVCGTVIGIGLPAVAMKELRRRKGGR